MDDKCNIPGPGCLNPNDWRWDGETVVNANHQCYACVPKNDYYDSKVMWTITPGRKCNDFQQWRVKGQAD